MKDNGLEFCYFLMLTPFQSTSLKYAGRHPDQSEGSPQCGTDFDAGDTFFTRHPSLRLIKLKVENNMDLVA